MRNAQLRSVESCDGENMKIKLESLRVSLVGVQVASLNESAHVLIHIIRIENDGSDVS